ncbi:rab9 effector protein with kelch motifs-like isoform X2 [Asparagus officinalis]|uniref:rab9 effector protein with kelch motifs-like isoform X2 n=1 Tax=Asparagus officinalis TaxID=4686 RepID=UPI00098E86FA|nr:rab9 effector protein with kelch motifs-like isoform X2 [Asparagus officinalis]
MSNVFDTAKKTWSKPLMKGAPPSPRDSHSCTTVGNRLFVFGGTDGTTPLKDLHVLDTSCNTWIVPAVSGEGPDAREGHSATLVDKRLFIFGGCGKSSDTHQELYFNDLYILDTEKFIWERAITSGTPPSPRDSHTCSSWNRKIIVLGGEDQSDCYLSDVYMLDAEALVWKQVNTSGQMLAPRAGHTTVLVGSCLFVFGGFTDSRNLYDDLHVLNVGTSTWSRVVTTNKGPSARFSVAGDCLDEQSGIIAFIGGCNRHLEALDDMYYLHTSMKRENGLTEQMQDKSSGRRVFNMCPENNLPAKEPEKNNNVNMQGLKSDPSPFTPLQTQTSDSSSALKVPFEATITEENQHGYSIETIIDGKLFRGVVFSSTALPYQDGRNYPKKRRMRKGYEGIKLSEHQPLSNTPRVIPQETKTSGQEQITATYAKGSASKASSTDILVMGLTKSTTTAGPHLPNMASENVEPQLHSSRNLEAGFQNMGSLKSPFAIMINDSKKSYVSPVKDLTTTQIMQPLSMPLETLKIDSEKLEMSQMPTEDLKPSPVPSETLKDAGISDETPATDKDQHPDLLSQGYGVDRF